MMEIHSNLDWFPQITGFPHPWINRLYLDFIHKADPDANKALRPANHVQNIQYEDTLIRCPLAFTVSFA